MLDEEEDAGAEGIDEGGIAGDYDYSTLADAFDESGSEGGSDAEASGAHSGSAGLERQQMAGVAVRGMWFYRNTSQWMSQPQRFQVQSMSFAAAHGIGARPLCTSKQD